MTTPHRIRAGFIPLTDAAPLIVAYEKGFAEAEQVELVLSRETSWATIRDRLAVGHLDMAHALAPLPIAANLGLGPIEHDLVVPMSLGFGGNTICVSQGLWRRMAEHGATADFAPDRALAGLVGATRGLGRPPVMAVVHPHSTHNYGLAYWLAAGGLMPGRDVDIVVLPPSLMPDALASGRIDGYCAGEPWGSVATGMACGVIVTTISHIWRASPEKVLAVRADWAEAHPEMLGRVVRAVYAACEWCDAPSNRAELVEVLSRPAYVACDGDVLASGLSRSLTAADGQRHPVDGFLQFAAGAETVPSKSQALWFLAQMARWSEVALTSDTVERTRRTYRPDLYRAALGGRKGDVPAADTNIEGALTGSTTVGSEQDRPTVQAGGFFDGQIFDPDRIEEEVSRLRAMDAAFGPR